MPKNSPSATSKLDPVDRLELAVRHREVVHLDRTHDRSTLSAGDKRPGTGAARSARRGSAAWSRRRSRPTSCTAVGRPSGPGPARHRRRRVAGDVPEGDVRDGGHATASAEPTVPLPPRIPTLRRAVRDRRREQHVAVVEDPVGLRRHLLGLRERPVDDPRRDPRAHPVGLAGTPLQAVVVLDQRRTRSGCRRRTAARTPASGPGSAGRSRVRRGPRSASSRAVSSTTRTWTGSGRTPSDTGLVDQPIRSRPGSRPRGLDERPGLPRAVEVALDVAADDVVDDARCRARCG